MEGAALERITGTVLSALAGGEAIGAEALMFLLRRYGATDRVDLRGALEPALAAGLERQALAITVRERAAWLALFAEAITLSADARLLEAATLLVAALQRDWGGPATVEGSAVSVDAALRACGILDLPSIAPHAVDELERVVAASYRPGEGLVEPHHAAADGAQLANHIFLASALLTAYEISDRLPYPMLAEELVQAARRRYWRDAAGCFETTGVPRRDLFRLNCEASRVLCRLAALHQDPDYRAAAVIRDGAAYADDAARILESHAGNAAELGLDAAVYGLALAERLALDT
jgi:uncharacterized protein YyaL (SSP411 family)